MNISSSFNCHKNFALAGTVYVSKHLSFVKRLSYTMKRSINKFNLLFFSSSIISFFKRNAITLVLLVILVLFVFVLGLVFFKTLVKRELRLKDMKKAKMEEEISFYFDKKETVLPKKDYDEKSIKKISSSDLINNSLEIRSEFEMLLNKLNDDIKFAKSELYKSYVLIQNLPEEDNSEIKHVFLAKYFLYKFLLLFRELKDQNTCVTCYLLQHCVSFSERFKKITETCFEIKTFMVKMLPIETDIASLQPLCNVRNYLLQRLYPDIQKCCNCVNCNVKSCEESRKICQYCRQMLKSIESSVRDVILDLRSFLKDHDEKNE